MSAESSIWLSLGANWYTAGSFWIATASVAVTAIVGFAGATVAYRIVVPRRRLIFKMRSLQRLRIACPGTPSAVEVRHEGAALVDPHYLEICVANRGHRDISHMAFDNGQPIEIIAGAKVVTVLGVTSSPTSAPLPEIALAPTGTAVRVGPARLGAGQVVSIALVLDGTPAVSLVSPLIDVPVDDYSKVEQKWAKIESRALWWISVPFFTVSVFGLALSIAGLNSIAETWLLYPAGFLGSVGLIFVIVFALRRREMRRLDVAFHC